METPQQLLFVCTGNIYRSRHAEAVFNHHALLDQLPWKAISRGLRAKDKEWGLSNESRDRLLDQRIPLELTADFPEQLTEQELAESSLVIAVYEKEHRPMFAKAFPRWENRVVYWHVPDIDEQPWESMLPFLEKRVRHLADMLRQGSALGCGSAMEF